MSTTGDNVASTVEIGDHDHVICTVRFSHVRSDHDRGPSSLTVYISHGAVRYR